MVEQPTAEEIGKWIVFVEAALDRVGAGRTEPAGRPPARVDPVFGKWVDEPLDGVRDIDRTIGKSDLLARFNDRDPDSAEKVCQQVLARLRELQPRPHDGGEGGGGVRVQGHAGNLGCTFSCTVDLWRCCR